MERGFEALEQVSRIVEPRPNDRLRKMEKDDNAECHYQEQAALQESRILLNM